MFLGGPPLVKMATGEDADDEELGGAEMHSHDLRARATTWPSTSSTPSASAARSSSTSTGASSGPEPTHAGRRTALRPRRAARHRLGRPARAVRSPRGPRPRGRRLRLRGVQAALRPLAGHRLGARSTAIPVGVLANAQGVLFSEESQKATQFIQLANQVDTPLSSCRTPPATWSGKTYEQGGIIKDGAKMINAVANCGVPHLTVIMGASYGAGNYGMCGRRLRPALPVRVAERQDGGDGPAAAGRVSSPSWPASRPPRRARSFDEEADARSARRRRGADRAGVATPSS